MWGSRYCFYGIYGHYSVIHPSQYTIARYVSAMRNNSCFLSPISVVYGGSQAWKDLQIFGLVEILALFDLWRLGLPLLLCLSKSDPFLHSEMLIDIGECIGSKAQPFKHRALDWIQDDMVVGSGEIQNTQTIDVSLVAWGCANTVNAALYVSCSQCSQGVASIDCDGRILWLDPLPLTLVVQDLQCCNWLAEQQSH